MTQHESFCQACGMPMSAPDAQGPAIYIARIAATATVI